MPVSLANPNRAGLTMNRALRQHTADRAASLRRLASGRRIGRGADDPAGLIAAEGLRNHGTRLRVVGANADRALAVAATVEGAVREMGGLLLELKGLVGQAAGPLVTPEQRLADQRQIDHVVGRLDAIQRRASFNGEPLLHGAPAPPPVVPALDFAALRFGAFGRAGPPNGVSISDGGRRLDLSGDTLPYALLDPPYAITPRTILEFDFQSGREGEVHAIALADGPVRDTRRFIQLHGTYAGGNRLNDPANAYAGGTQHYKIRVGALYTGPADRIGFENDRRRGRGDSSYANVKIYEDGPPLDPAADQLIGRDFALDPAGRRTSELRYPEPSARRLGTAAASLHELTSGGTHDLASGRLAEAGAAVEAAIEQVAQVRGRIGNFARNEAGALGRQATAAALDNAAALAEVEDVDLAAEAAALARAELFRQGLPRLRAVARDQARGVLALLGG